MRHQSEFPLPELSGTGERKKTDIDQIIDLITCLYEMLVEDSLHDWDNQDTKHPA